MLLLQDQDLRSPLHAAAFLGDVRIIDLLIKSGVTPAFETKTWPGCLCIVLGKHWKKWKQEPVVPNESYTIYIKIFPYARKLFSSVFV